MNPLPIVLMGVSGASGGSDNATGAIQVTGTGGSPVAIVGAEGNYVPVGVTVGTLGVTGEVRDRETAKVLERLNTILGATQGSGAGGLSKALSIYDALPGDAGDAMGRRLPSHKQLTTLIDAFSQTAGGDTFVEILSRIAETLDGQGTPEPGLQETVSTDFGNPNVGVNLRNFSSPNVLLSMANICTAATNTMQVLVPTSTPVSGSVRLKAHPENDGLLYVADASISLSQAKFSAFPLQPGEEVFLEVDNLDLIYFGSEQASNVISVLASRLQ